MLYLVDMPLTDLLIVMGTSLEVYPVADIIWYVRPNVPRLLINKTSVSSFADKYRKNDVIFQGDVIEGVKKLCAFIGWEKELQQLMDNRGNDICPVFPVFIKEAVGVTVSERTLSYHEVKALNFGV
ncbi:unnamed protein product [Soboliphyme baturini]|uniref:Deacetylase sirtuin-type domain-containing protein n=1 Tax=Soboliphyme baturini TaxID=241478 RepID=A0A183J8R6_9BILA|nr:unnamed protein product [Soboliphyme baturini]